MMTDLEIRLVQEAVNDVMADDAEYVDAVGGKDAIESRFYDYLKGPGWYTVIGSDQAMANAVEDLVMEAWERGDLEIVNNRMVPA